MEPEGARVLTPGFVILRVCNKPSLPHPRPLFRPIQHLLLFFLFVRPFNCLASCWAITEILYSLNEGYRRGAHRQPGGGPAAAAQSRGQDLQSQSPQHSVAEEPPLSFSLASQGLSGPVRDLDNRSGELHTSAQRSTGRP